MSDDRMSAIAEYVRAHGDVRIDTLTEHFGVSRMTIHRHIERLARQGVLRKLHGAVTAQPSSIYESLYAYRAQSEPEVKAALARAALSEITPGLAVALDDSTTATALGPLLAQTAPLSVITNSLALMQTLAGVDDIALIGVGGDYAPTYNAFIGPGAEDALARLRVNVAICSASGIADGAALVQDGLVTRAKAAMLDAAERRVLLAASPKFGRIALNKLAPLTSFDAVYTDSRLAEATARSLRDAGVTLHIVEIS